MLQKPWIEVWPIEGRELSYDFYSDTDRGKFALNKELSDHVENLWKPKSEKGWKSSWVPFIKKVGFIPQDYPDNPEMISLEMGVMAYKEIEGINDAIEKDLPFISTKYNPCLSVGFLTSTKDSKVIFQRRSENVHCPNILIHEPCGYMTSMAFAPRSECNDYKYVSDHRLFDIDVQLKFRKKEIAETFDVPEESVSYELGQDLLGCGWKTIEMYFSTTGKIDVEQKNLRLPKNQEVFFVPFEHLKDLIYNQGKLSQVNPDSYRPKDPREIPLIDESLIGLIYGYEKLTGDKLDINETIDKLNRDGLEIHIHDTLPGKSYKFPTSL